MAVLRQRRWKEAFKRVRSIERRSAVLEKAAQRRSWNVHGSTAVRVDVEPSSLPRYLRPKGAPTEQLQARVNADLIRIGKFDVDREVRLRAFYPKHRQTIRFQAGGLRNGVTRSLDAYRYISKYVLTLSPKILDHGTIRGAPYLIEEVAKGRHPVGPTALEATIGPLTAGLARLHDGVGVQDRALTEILGQGFQARWATVVGAERIETSLQQAVQNMLARGGTLPVSLGHGDLVGTNILVSRGGVTLIDWEYAGEMPILFDVAKIHMHCPAPDTATDLLAEGLRTSLRQGSEHFSVREQLALAHVRFLSWSTAQRRRAIVANRLSQFERIIQRRLEAVRELLDLT